MFLYLGWFYCSVWYWPANVMAIIDTTKSSEYITEVNSPVLMCILRAIKCSPLCPGLTPVQDFYWIYLVEWAVPGTIGLPVCILIKYTSGFCKSPDSVVLRAWPPHGYSLPCLVVVAFCVVRLLFVCLLGLGFFALLCFFEKGRWDRRHREPGIQHQERPLCCWRCKIRSWAVKSLDATR